MPLISQLVLPTMTAALCVVLDNNLDGLDEGRFIVHRFFPFGPVEFLNVIRRACQQRHDDGLQIPARHLHAEEGIDQHEIRAVIAIIDDVQKKSLARRVRRMLGAFDFQKLHAILCTGDRIAVIGGWFWK